MKIDLSIHPVKLVPDNTARPASPISYLTDQHALLRSGAYWNCLTAARHLAKLLLDEGRRPWLARLQKAEVRGGGVFHVPLTPRMREIHATWTTHYVCCCDGLAYDPVAGRTVPVESYAMEVFGRDLAMEVFVAADAVPGFLQPH